MSRPTEARGNLTVTVRHNRRTATLDAIRAIGGGIHVGDIDTSFGSHTIVGITAPKKAIGNGLPAQLRAIRGVIDVQQPTN